MKVLAKQKDANSAASRAFRAGGFSAFISLIVLAIAVTVNLLLGELPASLTKLDMTGTQLFTISQQTENLIGSLDEDVTVYLLAQTGNEDQVLIRLLESYQELSPHVKVVKKDPVVFPNFAAQYTDQEIYDNSLIVTAGERSSYISYFDIYVVDQNSYMSYYYGYSETFDADFDGESALTSAIDYLTSDNLPTLYALAGHGEKTLGKELSAIISRQNIEVEPLNLLARKAIPDDAECLLIYAPRDDLSLVEAELIREYLEQGGHLLLISDFSTKSVKTRLLDLMANYGVTAEAGLVLEGDANRCVGNYPHYLLPQIMKHEISNPLRETGALVLMPVSQPLAELPEHRSSLKITKMLVTSEQAYIKEDGYDLETLEKLPEDREGQFCVALAISEPVSNGESRIVWFSGSEFMDSSVDQAVNGSNQDLLLNALGWMCDRESSISIHSKRINAESLTIPAATASLWSVVLIGAVPLLVLALGLRIIVKRRRR